MERWTGMVLIAAALVLALPATAQEGSTTTTLTTIEASPGPAGPVDVIGGDEASLRALLARVLMPAHISSGPAGETATVYVGALPEALPFDVPLPEGAEVVGAMLGLYGEEVGQIYANLPGPAEAVEAFYAEALGGAGWRPAPQMNRTGFVSALPGTLVFCSDDDETLMTVMVLSQDAAMIPVNVQWQHAYAGACGDDPAASSGINPLVPVFELPPTARVRGGSSGGSSDASSFVSASIATDHSAAELAALVEDQTVAAGWEKTGEASTDIAHISTWAIADDRGDAWAGILAIMEGGEEDVFALFQMTHAAE